MNQPSEESSGLAAGAGREPCACDNLHYLPPDASGRRSIFIPENAWADEPVPPMPRDYGLEQPTGGGRMVRIAPGNLETAMQDVSTRPYREADAGMAKNGFPQPGTARTERLFAPPGPSDYMGPARSTNPNVSYLPGFGPMQRSTFLGESTMAGPGTPTLAQAGIVQAYAHTASVGDAGRLELQLQVSPVGAASTELLERALPKTDPLRVSLVRRTAGVLRLPAPKNLGTIVFGESDVHLQALTCGVHDLAFGTSYTLRSAFRFEAVRHSFLSPEQEFERYAQRADMLPGESAADVYAKYFTGEALELAFGTWVTQFTGDPSGEQTTYFEDGLPEGFQARIQAAGPLVLGQAYRCPPFDCPRFRARTTSYNASVERVGRQASFSRSDLKFTRRRKAGPIEEPSSVELVDAHYILYLDVVLELTLVVQYVVRVQCYN